MVVFTKWLLGFQPRSPDYPASILDDYGEVTSYWFPQPTSWVRPELFYTRFLSTSLIDFHQTSIIGTTCEESDTVLDVGCLRSGYMNVICRARVHISQQCIDTPVTKVKDHIDAHRTVYILSLCSLGELCRPVYDSGTGCGQNRDHRCDSVRRN